MQHFYSPWRRVQLLFKRSPKFSVVLPTHNRSDVLPFAIESVLSQTKQDFELLVVGDGCTDHTADVVKAYRDSRIRWFDLQKAPHFGYANRNFAFHECRGELIAAMAHDDLWLPDHLEMLYSCFSDDKVELAYSMPVWVLPDGLIVPTPFNLHDPKLFDEFLALRRNSAAAVCFVHRRSCFIRYGYWDENLTNNGDIEMWGRIIKGGDCKNFRYLRTPTTLHYRANWRTAENAGPVELISWQTRRASLIRVAPQLQIELIPGKSEQEATWRALKADPTGWTSSIREGLVRALDLQFVEVEPQLQQLSLALQYAEAERWQARARHGLIGHDSSWLPYRLSFERGFYQDEGWRWAEKEASLQFIFFQIPQEVVIEWSISGCQYHEMFPFSVKAIINEQPIDTWQFTVTYHIHSLRFKPLEKEFRIRFISESSFNPAQIGISFDDRELAIMLTKIEVFQ